MEENAFSDYTVEFRIQRIRFSIFIVVLVIVCIAQNNCCSDEVRLDRLIRVVYSKDFS